MRIPVQKCKKAQRLLSEKYEASPLPFYHPSLPSIPPQRPSPVSHLSSANATMFVSFSVDLPRDILNYVAAFTNITLI